MYYNTHKINEPDVFFSCGRAWFIIIVVCVKCLMCMIALLRRNFSMFFTFYTWNKRSLLFATPSTFYSFYLCYQRKKNKERFEYSFQIIPKATQTVGGIFFVGVCWPILRCVWVMPNKKKKKKRQHPIRFIQPVQSVSVISESISVVEKERNANIFIALFECVSGEMWRLKWYWILSQLKRSICHAGSGTRIQN